MSRQSTGRVDQPDIQERPDAIAQLLAARRVGRPTPKLQIVAAVVLLVLLAMLIHSFVTQPNYAWHVVWDYLFSHQILDGLRLTCELTVFAMLIGISVGTCVAIMRSSSNPLVSGSAKVYIWLFRGTPTLVQILFWYNLAALLPQLSIGIPFGPEFATAQTNDVVTATIAACLGLGLSQAAYTSEIVRGGILGVDSGQVEAAVALGLRRRHILRRIVLPQALPIVIPPIGNEVIGMLKYSSLVSVIAVAELLGSAQRIYSSNFLTIPLLIVAVIWYLALTSVLTVLQGMLERRLGRSRAATAFGAPRKRRGGKPAALESSELTAEAAKG